MNKPQTCLWLVRQNGRIAARRLDRSQYGADGLEGLKMLISLMLVCAILASLALGVLAAYGICLGFFQVMAGRTATARTALEPAPAKAKL